MLVHQLVLHQREGMAGWPATFRSRKLFKSKEAALAFREEFLKLVSGPKEINAIDPKAPYETITNELEVVD
jgi:hypothetical protein